MIPELRGRISVGAYVCPNGASVVECRRTRAGLEIMRTFDVPAHLETAAAAADHLVRVITSAAISRADVSVAIRGFGLQHHVLQLPPADDEILTTIIEREMRRLEPQLVDFTTAWIRLPVSPQAAAAEAQSAQLAVVVPDDTVMAFEQRFGETQLTLAHLTALPSAMARIAGEFDAADDISAMVAALPDGAFFGFFLGNALRLVVEPPFHVQGQHDAVAVAEEAELGSMFLRQQFRGARVDRVTIIGAVDAVDDAESTLAGRLGVPVKRFALRDLSAAAHAAVGAVLDAEASPPLSLGGSTRDREEHDARGGLHSAALVASLIALLVGAWTVFGAVQARGATDDLARAETRILQDSFGLAGVRSTAEQRKLIRNAQAALRIVATDRADLQQTIASVAGSIAPRLRLDSMALTRNGDGWSVVLGGMAGGETSARAVQNLNDFYQQLPRHLVLHDLSLDRMSYVDSSGATDAAVRFEVSFAAPPPRRN